MSRSPAAESAGRSQADLAAALAEETGRPASDDRATWRFGGAEINRRQRLLRIDGLDANLGGRAFDLLVALVERRDRIVSRNELFELVWPSQVVEDNNLSVHVTALRKLIGTQAIATVPGRGYRFTLVEDASPSSDPDAQPLPQSARAADSNAVRQRAPGYALPAPQALLGRDDELAALAHLLERHSQISVVGAGGIGKTTLALAAAHARRSALRDGAVWVDLAPISQPALLAGTVARALKLPVGRADDPIPALVDGLAPLELLLVLDNAEHLADAVAQLVDAIAAGAPTVRVLVTSQVTLKTAHERVFRLGPLSVPEEDCSAQEALQYGAVALFVDRAQADDRKFELTDANVGSVVRLCRQLDGLALALKLAAGRLAFFGLKGLEQRLADRLKLLAGAQRGAPTRQQTLRAALDWSYSLLSPSEQATFRRLGVFVGGFSLALASAVACDSGAESGEHGGEDEWQVIEHLATLVDRSLVTVGSGELPRYHLLESTREFALDLLAAHAEVQALRQRHAQAMETMLRHGWIDFQKESWQTISQRCGRDIDNVRAAMDWAAQHHPELALQTYGRSGYLFHMVASVRELEIRGDALAFLVDSVSPEAQAYLWLVRASSEFRQLQAKYAYAAKAAALLRRLGDNEVSLHWALTFMGVSGQCPPADWDALFAELETLHEREQTIRLRAFNCQARMAMLRMTARYEEAREIGLAGAARSIDDTDMIGHAALIHELIVTELAMGLTGEATARARELIDHRGVPEERGGGRASGLYARCLAAGGGDLAALRDALSKTFERCRRDDWHLFGQHACTYPVLPLREGRFSSAALVLGYAKLALRRMGRAHLAHRAARLAESSEALEAVLDTATLERLMLEGEALSPEQVCALTLGTNAAP